MLLDRYIRSVDFSDLSSAAGGRDSNAGGRPTPKESPAAAPTDAVTDTVGRNDCVYVLTRPDGPVAGGGLEWRLTFTATEGPSWSMALTARGAGPQAPIRVAQAVAVRVLAGFGIDAQGWEPSHPTPPGMTAGSPPSYRAVLAPLAARP